MSFVTTMSDGMHEPVHRIRTASSTTSELAHPTPDLQSLQGAYLQNVERLEEHAERMSVGSDLGEEIRRLQQEQKLSDSRRASLYSLAAPDAIQQRTRNVSTSSYANSIVEVNSAARYGGFSPYSPIGSLRSGSWSQISHPLSNPARSMSRRSSRFGIMSTPEVGETSPSPPHQEDHAADTNSSIQHTPRPQSKSNSSNVSGSVDDDTRERRMKRLSTGRLPSDGSFSQLYNQLAGTNASTGTSGIRMPSDTSFTDIYDQIAGEIKDQLDTSVIGAQERELKRQSIGGMHSLQPAFAEPQLEAPKPIRLSETPPPLPPQHKILPGQPPQEDFRVNFSFTASVDDPQSRDDRRQSGPLQIHVPHDEHDDNDSDRPTTARSEDTFQQAEGLFQDFDGTHYAPSMLSRYGSLRDPSGGSFPVDDPNRSSMLTTLPELKPPMVPPPEEGMVYYPAPVPRMLNLPQRISQAPSAAILAKRKTQYLNALPEDARKSAHWLPQGELGPGSADARASRMNLASLPPQLRASVFFDPGTKRQDIEIRDQSAMKTFDDLLNASAFAPVSAFTDHPIVGKVGGNVYRKAQDNRISSLEVPQVAPKKERKSSFLGFRRSSVSSEQVLEDRRASALDHLTKTNSVALDDSGLARGPRGEIGGISGRSSPDGVYGDLRDEDALLGEYPEEHEAPEDREDHEAEQVGAPTTLLAELEMRKKEQKNRTRNAYNAFPDGMHATLLEMDDVMQLQKAKRKTKRVALAWEDPALKEAEDMAEGDDEDVPLGVLYSNNKSVAAKVKAQELAEGRPMGLMEKKDMEDNEPLSRRRMRLMGINPNAVRAPPVAITNPDGESESESEHEGETLGQRMQRLRDKKALDDAISEVHTRPASAAFSVDLLSQLGVDTSKADEKSQHARNVSTGQVSVASAPKSPGGGLLPAPDRSNANSPSTPGAESEEETLGQRRARLQREALQSGSVARPQSQFTLNPQQRMSTMPPPTEHMMALPQPQRPPMRASVSMADLLAAYPSGKHEARKVSNEMLLAAAPQGSLLARDAEEKAVRKERMRMSSAEHVYQLQQPMYGAGNGMNMGGGGGMYMNQQQMYSMWQQQNAMMGMQMQTPGGYGQPQQQYGMMGMYGGGGYQHPQQYGMGMQYGMNGGQQGFGGMGMGMQQEPYIDPRTRSRVDAWRQSVMQ